MPEISIGYNGSFVIQSTEYLVKIKILLFTRIILFLLEAKVLNMWSEREFFKTKFKSNYSYG